MSNYLLESFKREFSHIVRLSTDDLTFDNSFLSRCQALASHLATQKLLPTDEREQAFLAHMNRKFRINSDHLGSFYGAAARLGETFNFHEKNSIQELFDRCNLSSLPGLLETFQVEKLKVEQLCSSARCAQPDETRDWLHRELEAPAKLRRELGDRNVRSEILKSLFASFLWESLAPKEMHRYFDTNFNEKIYSSCFWEELQLRSPRLFHRDQALHLLVVNSSWCEKFKSQDRLRDALLDQVEKSYHELNNYGFLAIHIQKACVSGKDYCWELAADITLFAEKHLEHRLDRSYFRYEKIKAATVEHIQELDENTARFDLVNEGFTYRDCFILENSASSATELLIIFQKNHRDETIVPCPTCRSMEVEGNSYPSLGVKSWECANPLCPDRSKYNRGKRYSFRGLTMQQAIEDEKNDIPPSFVKKWRRDVVKIEGSDDVLDHLLRHYSMHRDTITIFTHTPSEEVELLGRLIRYKKLSTSPQRAVGDWFINGAWFKRYGVTRQFARPQEAINIGDENLKVYRGDSRHILTLIPNNSIDGAVTSPPYYNAREYSQWPNIYCYLQDMFDVNREVYRTLKPGAYYFYNIFDYFDNENTVALSAMGNKRIPLSAYTVDLFRRIGFECTGNIVWDKGEIEGKRGFNAGNFSPFYQSPFNCWEHVLVFRKPGKFDVEVTGTTILRAKPVIKMVRGKNVHGHTAPYPEDIPKLCINVVPMGGTILDPFGGSLTTGRTAVRLGRKSVCIEQSQEYCDLGLHMYRSGTPDANQKEFEFSPVQ